MSNYEITVTFKDNSKRKTKLFHSYKENIWLKDKKYRKTKMLSFLFIKKITFFIHKLHNVFLLSGIRKIKRFFSKETKREQNDLYLLQPYIFKHCFNLTIKI